MSLSSAFSRPQGVLLDCPSYGFPGPSEKDRLICVNPRAFAHCCCVLNIDTSSKAFRFEAGRFWPKESGSKKPDPSILVRCLEEIPNCGLLQEMLLPLLWQVGDRELSKPGTGMAMGWNRFHPGVVNPGQNPIPGSRSGFKGQSRDPEIPIAGMKIIKIYVDRHAFLSEK